MAVATSKIRYFCQYMPVAILFGLSHWLPFDARLRLAGAVIGFAVRYLPPFRRRVDEGLTRVYPDMNAAARASIAGQVGRNIGRTLTEILHNRDFARHADRFSATGPGINALRAAREAGKGAIIVSAHFGQWEAIRHWLKTNGMETGAVYRRNSNPYYEPHFLAGIREGGEPIVPRGLAGTIRMVRHIRKGGFFAILADQYQQSGPDIPFLGYSTPTTTSPAELALKFDVPLVPAFGLRVCKTRVDITFETPIPPSDPLEMMAEFNTRVAAWINAYPGQWYWLHKRWKSVC
ncbi:MAG: lysophospholipid acyltransferase family protein [Rhodobacteraceae bacterium]|nr:lysophospholipid acyltransferase family protein [Paracoccaceae bacterium]